MKAAIVRLSLIARHRGRLDAGYYLGIPDERNVYLGSDYAGKIADIEKRIAALRRRLRQIRKEYAEAQARLQKMTDDGDLKPLA